MKKIFTLLFVLETVLAISLPAQVAVIGTGTDVPASTLYSPVYRFSATSTTTASRSNILYTQAELSAAGIVAGAIISSVEFYKANNANFVTPATLKMYMGNTANTTLPTTTTWASILTTHTEVYNNASFNVPNTIGWVSWAVTPFTYTGGSLEIATDLTMGGNGAATSFFQWQYTAGTPVDLIVGATGTTGPATLNGSVATYKNRPNIRITYSGMACTAPPLPGTATASPTGTVCNGQSVQLGLTGNSGGSGQTYAWESSPAMAGTYTNISAANAATGLTINPTSTLFYRAAVTCGGNTTFSAPVQVNVAALIAANTFTINSALITGGSNFQTFNDAINYIKCGISGPIIFNVDAASGPYTGQVTIPAISGTSATNTITINGNGRTLSFNSTNTNERAGIKLNGADYVTLNNLVITGTGSATTEYNWGIHLTNDADNNTINGCTLNMTMASTSTNFAGIVMSASATSATTNGSLCDNNTINANTIYGGYYAITLNGNASPFSTGNKVTNNLLYDFYFYGVHVSGNSGALIEKNDISRPTRTAISSFIAIYFTTDSENCSVSKNKIHDPFKGATTSTGVAYGVYFINCDATPGLENVVSNNLVYNFIGGGIQYGFYNSGSDSARYYHNTVSLEDAGYSGSAVGYGFYQTTTARGLILQNNIFKINRGGAGNKYCLYFAATGTASTITSNYNDLVNASTTGTSGTGYTALPAATGYTTLANWQAGTGQDANSVAVEPVFINPSLDNFIPTASTLDNKGTPAGITTDFAGMARSATTPDIGAYEFSTSTAGINMGAAALVVPTIAASGCYGNSEKVTIRIRNSSLSAHDFSLNPVTITTNVTGAVTQTLTASLNTGTLAAGTTMDVDMVQTLNMGATGVYTFNAATLMTGDVNTDNDAMQAVTRTKAALSAGTGAASPPSYCITPGTPTLSATGITGYSGLQWQQSTASGTGFTNIPGGTTSPFTIGSAISQTMYYRLAATCGGNTSNSNEIIVTLNSPQIVTTTPAARCGSGTVDLAATGNTGSTLKWYDVATGGTAIGTGSPFTTPAISATTDFYVSASNGAGSSNVGALSRSIGTGVTSNVSHYLNFTIASQATINSVDIFPNTAGLAGIIEITNSAGTTVVATINYTTTVGGDVTAQTIPVNVILQAGTYRMRQGTPAINLFRNQTGAVYPYTSGPVSITGNSFDPVYYYYFYNWQVSTGCESPRTTVTATVDCTVPVTLLNFKGEKAGTFNKLEWSTATETNNSGFELQRSADGVNFSRLVFVPTKAIDGNSNRVLVYNFDDVQPLLTNGYYRLKQIDKDNKAAYSQIVLITGNKPAMLTIGSIYPNPVSRQLNMIISAPQQEAITLVITDFAGRIVYQRAVRVTAGDNQVSFDVHQLQAGSYTIKALCSNGCKTPLQKFVKQ